MQFPPFDGSAQKQQWFAEPPEMGIDTTKRYQALLSTSLGEIIIALDAAAAPRTVNNFVFLALNHFYDGITFHRIIRDFVCQGGDPEGSGRGGPGYQFGDELPKPNQYKVGSLAMANAGPNTNGSQFFIISGPDGCRLPPQYSLFGQVVKGLDVLETMQSVPTGAGDRPKTDVVINSVRITVGDEPHRLIPSRSEWYRFNYSQNSCVEVVGRAQSLLANGNARDDINGRLGTNAEEVLAVACNSIGCDPDVHGSSTGFPVIQVHPSVLNYLGLNPDDFGGIEFAMTLGSYLDSQLGIVPVIFAGTRYQRRTRVVALIWSLVKAGDPELTHQREDFAAMARSLIDDGGDQGGLVEMSKLAIMVQRPQGGVDAMTGPFFVPLKLWRYLSMSVFSNARGASASKFSPPWPYPLQLSGSSQSDNLFASPGASRFLQWY